jgi:hypothetical protein
MDFDKKNRKLTSSTGYIVSKDGTSYYDHEIFLGKFDSASNYEEGTKEGYEAFVKAQEEKEKAEIEKRLKGMESEN